MGRVRIFMLFLLPLVLLVPAVKGQVGSVSLTVRVRDMEGRYISGVGVHLYAVDGEEPFLVGEQQTGADGAARFTVAAKGSYSVALYAPGGFALHIIPEEQQYLPGMGALGIETGLVGIGIVMGERDYTLHLVIQDGRPYYDTTPEEEFPSPFIPGISDAAWPTPTAYALDAASTSTPVGRPSPSPGGPPAGRITPKPFPWGPVLITAGIFGGAYWLYRLYSRGGLRFRAGLRAFWSGLHRLLRSRRRPAGRPEENG